MPPEDIFEIWAPPGGAWSAWAKPVLFAQLPESTPDAGSSDKAGADLDVPWAPAADGRTILVLDLPGAESVRTGLALAGRGYRPVPLFNACTGPDEVIPQGAIQQALRSGAPDLRARSLPLDAPPAFLLDQLRLAPMRPIRPGAFDNRWQVYPDDFPAAEVLRARGYAQVVLVQRGLGQPQDDLRAVLSLWQEHRLTLMVKGTDTPAPPAPLSLRRPSWLRRLWHELLASLGVRRSPVRGFGYVVPEPTHG